MKEKILVISSVIYPRLSPRAHRATELAVELARIGHDVTLCAPLGKYDYTTFERETKIHVRDLKYSKFETLNSDGDIIPIAIWRKIINRLLCRLLEFPSCLMGFRVRRFLKKDDEYDRIITIAIPHTIHWGTSYAFRHYKHLNNTVWIADCGDPYMGNPFQKHPFYFKWIEKKWCRTADYISVPTQIAINGYYPEFLDKIVVIPQGFRFDNIKRAEYIPNKTITFAYSGAVYAGKRDPRKMLNYLIKKAKDFKFVIYTRSNSIFDDYKNELGDKLVILPYIEHDVLIYELSKMDFLINIQNESMVQVPSKLIDYYMAGRPILNITSTFNEKEILDEFLDRDYSHQFVIENPTQYDIKNVAQKFLGLTKNQ